MNYQPTALLSRRALLQSAGCGFGYLALAGLCGEASAANPLAPRSPHHLPKAKRVIFLFMHGGPSHVDTFDYKPRLQKEDGGKLPFAAAPNVESSTAKLKLLGSPWKFAQHGECGRWISELFPHLAGHADDLCIINSLHSRGQSHGQAVCMLHTGTDNFVRPSVGAWVSYGLGTENENLPAFVSISPPRGHGGPRNYGSAFLPAAYQATPIGHSGLKITESGIRHLDRGNTSAQEQRRELDLLQQMNREHFQRSGGDEQIEGVIESFELAYRMQAAVPKVFDISGEPAHVQESYGIGTPQTDNFGRQCLLARRFAEAGVRYLQVSTPNVWDQHSGLRKGHARNALSVDKPIAGLLADLKARGMLEETLVMWGGEFGRTPIVQGNDGRDHNPQGFSMWLAGGGVRGGQAYGSTDDYGYYAINDKVHMHDLHATILWLMGLDHERLTYRYAGRDFRLTDVYGRVVREIMA